MPRWKLAWILEPATAEQADGTEEGERGFGSKRTDWALYPDAEGKERSGGQSGPRVEPALTWACPGPVSFDVGNKPANVVRAAHQIRGHVTSARVVQEWTWPEVDPF